MQLDDLIEEQSITSIAKKTNIATEVISKLFNKEFETMRFSQAMGAIRIIEREYRVNLDDLRQECQAHFEDHISMESGLVKSSQIKKKKTIFPKLFTVLLLILFVYSAWYFFTGYYKQKVSPLDPQSAISLIDTLLGKEDTATKEISEQPAVQKNLEQIEAPKKTNTSVKIEIPEKKEVQESIVEKVVALEPNESATESVVENTTESADGNVAKSTVVDSLDDNSNIAEAMSAETTTIETPLIEQSVSLQEAAEENLSENSASTVETPTIVLRESMVLLPQQEMWFRLTNEKNKKKRQFRRKYRYEIDLKANSWLFATENALFAFMNDDFFEEFGGAGKLFFRLDQRGVHQLSEDEYRAATK